MARSIVLLVFLLCPVLAKSQTLIGSATAPVPNEPICSIPVYLDPDGTNNTSGLFVGDEAVDFILFDAEGISTQLSDVLSDRNVLLVSGSYTCPRFRAQLSALTELLNDFSNEIELLIVYCVEAHPFDDISPYFGYVNPSSNNTAQGIIYNQPTVYSDRIEVVQDMLENLTVPGTVLLDTPCNEWWDVYGPAENNAYLIAQSGEIVIKHGWLNNFGLDMYSHVAAWLNGDEIDPIEYSGEFVLEAPDNVGEPLNESLHAVTSLVSNDSDAPVAIDIIRHSVESPLTWEYSICAGICYNPSIDSVRISLLPGEDVDFNLYAYPNGEPGAAMINVELQNPFSEENSELWSVSFSSNYNHVSTPVIQEFGYSYSQGNLIFEESVQSIVAFSHFGLELKRSKNNSIYLAEFENLPLILKVETQQGEQIVKFVPISHY